MSYVAVLLKYPSNNSIAIAYPKQSSIEMAPPATSVETLDEKFPSSSSKPSSELDVPSKEFAPISTPRVISRSNSQAQRPISLRSLGRSRSNNGYGCDEQEDSTEAIDNNVEAVIRRDGKDPFEVRWDGGESDPMNPRSMAHARKWIIVIIVSASSLCV